MVEYNENWKIIDDFALLKFNDHFATYASDLEAWHKNCKSWIYTHIYKYNKLWETLNLEYNPIWNVDGTETEIIDRDGDNFEEFSKGSTSYTDDHVFGNKNTDSHYTDTNKVSPADTNAFFNSTQMDGENHTTEGAHTDQVIHNENKRTDATDGDWRDHSKRTLIKQGNIGVTKTQELIESEREIADFVFWETFFKDLVEDLCFFHGDYVGIDWGYM